MHSGNRGALITQISMVMLVMREANKSNVDMMITDWIESCARFSMAKRKDPEWTKSYSDCLIGYYDLANMAKFMELSFDEFMEYIKEMLARHQYKFPYTAKLHWIGEGFRSKDSWELSICDELAPQP